MLKEVQVDQVDLTETAMQLIAGAGDSRSYSMEAIMYAKTGEFDKARESIKNASGGLKESHDSQLDLLGAEADGKGPGLSLLMVHAQDHISMAILTKDMAQEFLDLYETLAKEGKK
jgi:PTS system cellobiose-specific IIA component